jgi:hypothetical protein
MKLKEIMHEEKEWIGNKRKLTYFKALSLCSVRRQTKSRAISDDSLV